MHTYSLQDAFYKLKDDLSSVYDASEATAIAHTVLEHITGLNKLQRLGDKNTLLSRQQQLMYEEMKARLMAGEPLQYVTGVQWFLGHPFLVDKSVLIPRPETEELVEWIVTEWKDSLPARMLDVGTGSGCIPISLKLQMPKVEITSCDISKEALETAAKNAASLNADITLLNLDFLQKENWPSLAAFNVIVSNPPYIPEIERETLDKNVRDFEPSMALFVPDNDALLFYRVLAEFGKAHLNTGGAVYCELHKDYAQDCQRMFESKGYTVILKTDMHGNERMLKAILS